MRLARKACFLGCFALILTDDGCDRHESAAPASAKPKALERQETASSDFTDASFASPDGRAVKLSDYRGKKSVVLLFMRGFFGEFSCYHCGNQTIAYKENYDKLKACGAEVLMILPGAKDAKGYLFKIGTRDDKHPDPNFAVPYPVLYDQDFSACKSFHVPFKHAEGAFPVDQPATVVISKEGITVWSYHGRRPDDRPAIEEVLEILRTGKSPSETGAQPSTARSPAKPTLGWMPYEKALEEAKISRKPLLVDFYADW